MTLKMYHATTNEKKIYVILCRDSILIGHFKNTTTTTTITTL